MTKVTLTIPRVEFDAILHGRRLYISAEDLIDHLDETAKSTEPINEDATAVLQAYRRTIAKAVERKLA